jgi:hypothetical protein
MKGGRLNMGAVVVHGQNFKPKPLKYNGSVYIYLQPIDGDSFELSYSSLEVLKKECESYGVSRDWWPDYIDLGGYNVPIEDMLNRNRLLKESLLRLTTEQIRSVDWLAEICDIVRKGELFYIH